MSSGNANLNTGTEDVVPGILAVLLCSLCFGTVHVPIRRFHSGANGFFVQLMMSLGILLVGFVVNTTESFPQMQPLAIFGGMLWCIANSLAQYIITGLGLAVGVLLWNTANCLTGWSVGRFGFFGLDPNIPPSPGLNYLGLTCVLVGGLSIALVKKSPKLPPLPHFKSEILSTSDANSPNGTLRRSKSTSYLYPPYVRLRLNDTLNANKPGSIKIHPLKDGPVVTKPSQSDKGVSNLHRAICIILSLLSGFFYSVTVVPVLYMEEHSDNSTNHTCGQADHPSNHAIYPSNRGLAYLYSHYFGIFLGSSIIFVVYASVRKNRPSVNPSTILPSVLGGVIWGVGMAMLFVANDKLTPIVTYPIMTTLPGCIAALWSIFFFREINTRRNYAILAFAFVLIACGGVLVFLSKFKG